MAPQTGASSGSFRCAGDLSLLEFGCLCVIRVRLLPGNDGLRNRPGNPSKQQKITTQRQAPDACFAE
jgi:hypothetical protein